MVRSLTRFTAFQAQGVALALLAGSIGLTGCRGSDLGGKGAQDSGSLLGDFLAPPTPQEAAAWATDQYDADKRARGMLMLANAPFGGERVYLDLYRAALNDGDPGVRAVAVRGLALHGSPDDVPAIVEQFQSKDRNLRWECARALQRLHNPVAVDPLTKALEVKAEPEGVIRTASAIALGQYAQGKSLDALIGALDDRDLSVNRAAQDSLRTLTGQDFGLDVRRWVAWRKESDAPFAGQTAYVYPVFSRDPEWYEVILPFWKPPNEIAASPVGMTRPVGPGASASEPPTPSGEDAKN